MSHDQQPARPDQSPAPPRKLLFVVKAKEKGSLGFDAFLRNRDWDVVATNDLKVALSAVFNRPIHCMLITVEHSNPQCMKLLGVIAQTTKVPVILFAEGLTPGGVNLLRGSDHPYVLAPPASGPAIERMVLRIEKEMALARRPGDTAIGHPQETKFSENDFLHLFDSERPRLKVIAGGSQRTQPSGLKEFTRLSPEEDAAVLDRAVAAALKGASVLNAATEDSLKILDHTSSVGCLQVESKFFTGVLVVAMADQNDDETNQHDPAKFISHFKNLLIEGLNDAGVVASLYDVPEFCLNETSFEEWAVSDASFLRTSIHQNGEVGISFFRHQVNVIPLRESEDATMSCIGLQEIREDVALAFDVYLYLPVNKKYIRYAAKERFLYDSQRERLNAGGVKDVHVKRDSEKDVARYRMQIGLNDKLRAYAGKKSA